MKERIIVSLTTWSKRIGNIPVVLETIFNQTRQPDFVVLNLAYDEIIPENVQHYIDSHNIEINRVVDTKVYKKLIPTLKKYPNDCVISIDDDWLYPKEMIADFVSIHEQYPYFPVSGNNIGLFGLQCHCGCASLTKAEYMGKYLNLFDQDVIDCCPSDDIVYTFFCNKAGHPYIRTKGLYFRNLVPYNDEDSYSDNYGGHMRISNSFQYLSNRFGKIDNPFSAYIKDEYIAQQIKDIFDYCLQHQSKIVQQETTLKIQNSYSYRIGNSLIKPITFLKRILRH